MKIDPKKSSFLNTLIPPEVDNACNAPYFVLNSGFSLFLLPILVFPIIYLQWKKPISEFKL